MSKEELNVLIDELDNMGTEASYKAILLLSLLKEIESGRIPNINFNLTDRWIKNFKTFYHNLSLQNPNVALPYFHIGKSNIFWEITWATPPQVRQLK